MHAKHENHHHITYKKHILLNVATTSNQNHDPSCNYRKKAECPLDGKCLQANDGNNNRIVRRTGIKLLKKTKERYRNHNDTERYRNHNTFFRNANRRNAMELSEQYMDPEGRKQNISN